jgi:hypothetical protein
VLLLLYGLDADIQVYTYLFRMAHYTNDATESPVLVQDSTPRPTMDVERVESPPTEPKPKVESEEAERLVNNLTNGNQHEVSPSNARYKGTSANVTEP